jgi:IS5 family transposase
MGRVKVRTAISNDKEERICRAIKERAAEGTALSELALKYGVPRTTLGDRLRGGLSMRQAKAGKQALLPYQEKALVKWVAQMEATGFPPRLDLFKAVAAELAKKRAEDEGDPKLAKIGTTWQRGFLDRHPELSAKYATKLDVPRAIASQPGPIRHYFGVLGRLRKQYKFKKENTYNMDEKGFMLGMGARVKVITRRGRKPPQETQDGSREWITVVETCCADDTMLPPMVIYQGQGLYRQWYDEDVEMDPRTAFAHSDKGFTTDELALEWLRDYFDPWTKSRANGEPRLLILDGHRSHYSLAFVRYARHNNIILLSYPGHSTHLLQPLDIVLFAPLQKAYSDAVAKYTRTSRCGVTKKDFWKFYRLAMKAAYTKENIKSAWRKAGIEPFNPDAVLQPLLKSLALTPRRAPIPTHPTPSKFLIAKTPRNRPQLRHHVAMVKAVVKEKLGDSKEAGLVNYVVDVLADQRDEFKASQDISIFEKEEIRAHYAGKERKKGTRQKLTKARVMDWESLRQMEEGAKEQDRVAEEKVKKAKERAEKKAEKELEKAEKAKERAEKKAEKAAEKAAKDAEKAERSKIKAAVGVSLRPVLAERSLMFRCRKKPTQHLLLNLNLLRTRKADWRRVL